MSKYVCSILFIPFMLVMFEGYHIYVLMHVIWHLGSLTFIATGHYLHDLYVKISFIMLWC